MESRHKRSRSQLLKWVCYALLALLCAVLQTTPGLFQLDAAKPLYLLPLALAVAVFEDAFSGAVFGAVLGLLWDWLAGRTVGMLARCARPASPTSGRRPPQRQPRRTRPQTRPPLTPAAAARAALPPRTGIARAWSAKQHKEGPAAHSRSI